MAAALAIFFSAAVIPALPAAAQSGSDALPLHRSLPAPTRIVSARPGPTVPAAQRMFARAQHAALLRAQSVLSGSPSPWWPVGPLQINTPAWNLVTGRITSIAADPADSSGNTVYLGTSGGGIWKSLNAAVSPSAVSFFPLTDNLSALSSAALASLSIGAVSVQPGGTGVILGGTGDPNDASDSWYGAGLLRSADGGNTWNLITQTTPEQSQGGAIFNFIGNAFAGFAWSTVNPDLVVAAVTQSTYGGRIAAPSSGAILGLYYSTDAGLTWRLSTLQDGATIIQSASTMISVGNAATSIVWNPIRRRFYAAIRRHGYYESADGITFTRLQSQPGSGLSTSACPANRGLPASSSCPIERGALAIQPATGDIFALTVDQNSHDQGLWLATCHLVSGACGSASVQFATEISDAALDAAPDDTTIPQGTYDLWLAAVPWQQDTLLFAGTSDIWRCSLADNCVLRNTTNSRTCDSAQVAPAQHAVDTTFAASGLLFFGNDGGLWRSTDAVNEQQPPCSTDDAVHYQNLNRGIGSLAEVVALAQDPASASTMLAAVGGLGTAASAQSTSAWQQILDGEGDEVAIDPESPGNWYATHAPGVSISRCTQGSACDAGSFGSAVIGEAQVENDIQSISAPWLLDPANSSRLILGTCRVWRGPANGVGWSDASRLSGMMDGQKNAFCNGDAEIRSLAAAPVTAGSPASGAERIYAGMAGAADHGGSIPGQILTAQIDDASQASNISWSNLSISPVTNGGLSTQFNPGRFDISSIYIDPHDPTAQTIYATIQGYSTLNQNSPLLYRSSDAGAHWLNITNNLPDAPANSVAVDPNDANIVYVALDTGVYYTLDVSSCGVSSSGCWNVLGSGLPNAPVISLRIFNQGSTQLLRAATWGRGIWEIGLLTAGSVPTSVTASPAQLDFESQLLQSLSPAQTVTLTNTGSVPLTISAMQASGDFSETDNCTGQPIAPLARCQVNVVFDPTQIGSRQGSLTIFGNLEGGGQLVIGLAGTGLSPGTVVITPSALAFPATILGSAATSQALDVANTGSAPVTISGKTVSGDYSIAKSTCQPALAAQTSCEIDISFQPTADGTRNGLFTMVDSAGTQTVFLSGTGQTASTDTLSAASLAFPAQMVGTTSAPQQLVLTNTGDAPLTSIAVFASGNFAAVSNCGAMLQGHGSCSIAVTYVPAAIGPASGVLTVSDLLRTQQVALSGTGVASAGVSASPMALTFAPRAVASPSPPQLVTIANNSGSVLTGLTASVTGTAFAMVSNNCPASLDVGSSCQLGISFTPAATGAATAMLTVTGSDLPRSVVVPLSGSGADFALLVAGSAKAVINSGQNATFALQLVPVPGSSGTIALTCSGLPQNATCILNPPDIALSSANTASVAVAIATGVTPSTGIAHNSSGLLKGFLPALAWLFPAGLLGLRRRRSVAEVLICLLLILAITAGCSVAASSGSLGTIGGGGGSTGGLQNTTPSGTYSVAITATMDSIVHTVTVKLIVQ